MTVLDSHFTLKKIWGLFCAIPLEAYIWTAGLIALACTNPNVEGHFDLCLFKRLGLPFCPGCGLGHSITLLFHGAVIQSFSTHPLGPFAVVVLVERVISLTREAYFSQNRLINNI